VLKDSNKRIRKGAAKALEKIAKQDKGEILSGTLSEKERKTLERLVAEVRDASEEFGLDCVRLKMLKRNSLK